ncbi:EF-P lysine aminoacylase EpmA [Pseudobdellovibrio exovorus]|uniref:Lysyl-tRNA synthetase n=1 Tax=Pseudobdellovibrio exovorus JSS TaxID=1184267 RepID=M4V6Q6_9BACT|nr:EF-P lysine aminoacylase EpmA [Pseudobdellovibrio exovorus]AGH94888.1 lysyl-tRNA synthetase [Pseudobdellovibrio exovorus JSS]
MIKTRDEYLQKHWTRYPEMPRGALKWGRVENLRLGTHQLSQWNLKDSPSYLGQDILQDGDLVALFPANQIVLLAPNLSDRTMPRLLWSEHQKWQEFLVQVRQVFREKKFQEVKTPTLVKCPGTEPTLEVFETQQRIGSEVTRYFLPTSPELNLKKLLSEGAEKIFEIAPVFRNGERTERHSPEFTMLEWYRAFAGLHAIKMDVIELVETLCDRLKLERPLEVLTFTIPDLFKQYCDFDFKPDTTDGELKELAHKLGVDVSAATCLDDYFYLIFLEKIENKWPQDRLVFIEKYPPYQAALARIGTDGWAERFEFYWRGFELGNAFHELNDPVVQRQRSLEDLQKKQQNGKSAIELDENFFTALDFGLPPSAGIAVGVERLFMAVTQTRDISFLNRIYGT